MARSQTSHLDSTETLKRPLHEGDSAEMGFLAHNEGGNTAVSVFHRMLQHCWKNTSPRPQAQDLPLIFPPLQPEAWAPMLGTRQKARSQRS